MYHEEPILTRSTKVRTAEEVGPMSEIPLRKYNTTSKAGLSKVIAKSLDMNPPEPESMALALRLDTVWAISYTICEKDDIPSWAGFNQTVLRVGDFDVSCITILPNVNSKADKLDTIYSALHYGQILAEKYGIKLVFVTFDQPLYIKATDIILAYDELKNLISRLGGFHKCMSYLGAIAMVVSGSGLQTMWEQVYAAKSVTHMLSGSAYARALRAHLLSVQWLPYFRYCWTLLDVQLASTEPNSSQCMTLS